MSNLALALVPPLIVLAQSCVPTIMIVPALMALPLRQLIIVVKAQISKSRSRIPFIRQLMAGRQDQITNVNQKVVLRVVPTNTQAKSAGFHFPGNVLLLTRALELPTVPIAMRQKLQL